MQAPFFCCCCEFRGRMFWPARACSAQLSAYKKLILAKGGNKKLAVKGA